jgi:uncharacterized protein
MSKTSFVQDLENLIFDRRRSILLVFALATFAFGLIAGKGLAIDSEFTKQLPIEHEYMRTFLKHRAEFGGADRVLIALVARDGNMFTPQFFRALRTANDAVFDIPGIDRARMQSLYTPNVRYTEVVEDGIQAGNVVPADFQAATASAEDFARIRANILKAGIVGRLVANDFSGAMISANLLPKDAQGKAIDPIGVARELEQQVRAKLGSAGVDVAVRASNTGVDVHMIGFPKVVGDIADGAVAVSIFAVVTVAFTFLFVWIYCQSLTIALIPVFCSIVAVIWQLGLLVLFGFGVDPLGILVPFLVFAIGVSHGVQKITSVREAAWQGVNAEEAARRTFRRLLLPAVVALIADLVGFVTILIIPVPVIREMAITASLGVAAVILTDLILLPVLVSFVRFSADFRARLDRRLRQLAPLWATLANAATRGPAAAIIVAAVLLGVLGAWKGRSVAIGDTQTGVPELRPDSRYNLDSNAITRKFSIGVDMLNVIVETHADGCISYDVMNAIDRFAWHMQNVPGVQDVVSLAGVMKIVSSGWSEGSLKWRNIPRNEKQLVQAQAYLETSTGLFNRDCSVMPVFLFTRDHRADTISRIVAEVKRYRVANPTAGVEFKLATGNVGVMAATNEEVKAKEYWILAGVFGAVGVMCLLTFRSLTGTLCVMLPLVLVSVFLAYAVMAIVGIGLKISTLPMVALGAGIGVDYGIYLFARVQEHMAQGMNLRDAFERALQITGSSIVFTGICLALGVVTWVFSPLQFQADIGVLLTFLFLVNMIGAIVLVPALAAWIYRPARAA